MKSKPLENDHSRILPLKITIKIKRYFMPSFFYVREMNDEVLQEMEHDADKDVNVATALNTLAMRPLMQYSIKTILKNH